MRLRGRQNSRMATFRSGTVSLTSRQEEVLRLIAKGFTNGEIAEKLGISVAGAKWHVSELLMKFNLETREQLAEQWHSSHQWSSRVRSAGWLGALFTPKAAAFSGLAVALAGGSTVIAVALTSAGGDIAAAADPASPTKAASVTLTTAGASTATAVAPLASPYPASIDAAALPADALQEARAQAFAALVKGVDEFTFVPALDARALTLTEVRHFSGVTEITMADADLYWSSPDSVPMEATYFHFADNVGVRGPVNFDGVISDFLGDISIDVVLRDGDLQLLGSRSELRVGGVLKDGGGGYDIRSHSFEEAARLRETPASDSYVVAYLDGVAAGARIELFRNQADGHCMDVYLGDGAHASSRLCGFTESVADFLNGVGGPLGVPSWPDSSGPRSTGLLMFPTRITRFDIVATDGTVRSFDLTPAPAELRIDASFAMVSVDTEIGSPIVIAYAGHTEAGRWPVQVP